MERYQPGTSMFKPAMYRICIFGTLDKKWSDYYGGMTIENVTNPHADSMTILTGTLADQSALLGVLNSLYDLGSPILSVEYIEAASI